MFKFFKRKSFALLAAAVGVTALASLVGGTGAAAGIIKTVFSPVLSAAANISDKISEAKIYFISVREYKDEVDRLTKQLAENRENEKSIAEYKAENARLKQTLELKNELEESFEACAASVVSYEPNNWYDNIVINKGSLSGIEEGDAVISPEGVVGKVTETGLLWARVASVISTDNAIGTRIIATGDIAVTEGDTELCRDKLCRLTYINNDMNVNAGYYLETSGAGGVYPEGIVIGFIKEIRSDSSGTRYGVVEPAVDFTSLSEVIVLTGNTED